MYVYLYSRLSLFAIKTKTDIGSDQRVTKLIGRPYHQLRIQRLFMVRSRYGAHRSQYRLAQVQTYGTALSSIQVESVKAYVAMQCSSHLEPSMSVTLQR